MSGLRNEKKAQRTMAVKNLKKLLKPFLKLVKRKQFLQQRQPVALQPQIQQSKCSQSNYEREQKEENHKTLAEIQQNAYNASLEDMRRDPASLNAAVDNYANEQLEQQLEQLQQELQQQHQQQQQVTVIVQRSCNTQQQPQSQFEWVVPVGCQTPNNQQYSIPVHFARTSTGTFFWTTREAIRQHEWQLRAQYDRWGQA